MRFEASTVTSLVTATLRAPLAALRAPATERMLLRELGISLVNATATWLGLCRATTVSVTPASTVAGQNKSPGGPASASLIVPAWTTAPVVAAVDFREIIIPAAVGAGVIWTFPADDPLIIGNGSAIGELVLVNLQAVAPSIFRLYAVWED